jgi:hypothetical protein
MAMVLPPQPVQPSNRKDDGKSLLTFGVALLLAGQALNAQPPGLLRADREHRFAPLNHEDIAAIKAASLDTSETGTTVTLFIVNGHFACSELEFVHEKLPPCP